MTETDKYELSSSPAVRRGILRAVVDVDGKRVILVAAIENAAGKNNYLKLFFNGVSGHELHNAIDAGHVMYSDMSWRDCPAKEIVDLAGQLYLDYSRVAML